MMFVTGMLEIHQALFSTRSSAVAQRPHNAICQVKIL